MIGRSGLPTFVYDAFSWEGKTALARFLKRNTTTGRWLRRYVPAERRLSVLAALFRLTGTGPAAGHGRAMTPLARGQRLSSMKLSDPAAFLDMIRADRPLMRSAPFADPDRRAVVKSDDMLPTSS